MTNLVKALYILKDRFVENLRCIETGTIRSYNENHNSTLHIAKTLQSIGGSFISIDINPKSIEISKDICKELANIIWICSDSIEYLKKENGIFHFAFLDTKNNPDFIFEEFRLIAPKMIVGGIIIIDDAGVDIVGNIVNGEQKKGHKVSKFLKSLGWNDFVRNSSHGTQLWIDVNMNLLQSIGKEEK